MNGETRYIGQGAGKMTLDEAYTKLPVNSTLVFDPGVYTIPGYQMPPAYHLRAPVRTLMMCK